MTAIGMTVLAAVCIAIAAPSRQPAPRVSGRAAARPSTAFRQSAPRPAAPTVAARSSEPQAERNREAQRQRNNAAWQHNYERQIQEAEAEATALLKRETDAQKGGAPEDFTDEEIYTSVNAPSTLHRVP